MPKETAEWRELNEFRDCEPSELAFRALVALLDTWPGADHKEAIDSAEKILSEWPDRLRLAPWSWCKAASKGAVLPTWKLVRAVQLSPHHLGKGKVDLARLAHFAKLDLITELSIPVYSDFQEVSFLYHRHATFPALKKLRAIDKRNDGEVRALAQSPLWRTLESLEINPLGDSLAHGDVSRIVPQLPRSSPIQHLTIRGYDLVALWQAHKLAKLRSVSIFIRSVDEARAVAQRPELSRLTTLSLAFRCAFSGRSPFEPFLGNELKADESAAQAFFTAAKLDRLETLGIFGYSMGYWGREGLGARGLKSLIASGLLNRIKHLQLQLLPLGDKGVAALARALGKQLETLQLQNVYCKGKGAVSLSKSLCLPTLKHLDLSGNRIDAESFAKLAQVEMPHLETLDLGGPEINPYYWNIGQQPLLDAGAIAWVNNPSLKNLKLLRMDNCFLGDQALQAIFQSSQFPKLQELYLSHNSFSAKGFARAIIDSPLWSTLREIGFAHCRLDNDAMIALSQVREAPALRSMELCYNSIGPKGAAALANWPVLQRVWFLNLHDNVIGDEGLIALAQSRYLGRLVELDLEQDCWNSRAFTFNDTAAAALAKSKSLRRLDSLFSGCVDEYHGACYSPGFSKEGLHILRKSKTLRSAFRASCSDFSQIGDYLDRGPFNEEAQLDEHDFRNHSPQLNEREAENQHHNMRQIGSSSIREEKTKEDRPPKICTELKPIEIDETDPIEGLEHRDPAPVTKHHLTLNLSLQDRQRPLHGSVGRVISETLSSILNATSLGSFDVSSSSSTEDEQGRRIETEIGYAVNLCANLEPAIQLIRECLWWVRAPGKTTLEKVPLKLTTAPERTAARFLQLATPKVVTWKVGKQEGFRIDRVPFTEQQRRTILKLLKTAKVTNPKNGWVELTTKDRGHIALHTKYLQDSPEFETLNILVEKLTPQISSLIYLMMHEGGLLLWPMILAASEETAGALTCDHPKAEILASADQLHELLESGPYGWWDKS